MRTLVTLAAAIAAGTVVAGGVACSDTAATNPLADRTPPVISIAAATSQVDSVISFTADVRDNLGIKRIHIQATGGVTATYDSVFTSAATTATVSLALSVPRSVAAGTPVTIIGIAYDGAGNPSTPDTLRLATGALAPANVTITSPPTGSTAIVGKSIILAISGSSKVKVQWLGFESGDTTIVAPDSTILTSPLADSTAIIDTVLIRPTAKTGTVTLTPFIRDSLGNRGTGSPITLKIQTASSSVLPPVVSFGSDRRVEVTDTVFVSAIDTTGAGMSRIGYEISSTPSSTSDSLPAAIASDSAATSTQFTSVQHTFTLQLPSTLTATLPQTIYLRAYAVSGNGARGYARLANGRIRADTLTLVAGETHPIPSGGQIADALYHPSFDKLYLTNIERDEIEVFDLARNSFSTPIAVGSRPWGIAAWPRDRFGTYGDTLLVANSGGTSIGYVTLRSTLPTSPEGREFYTYPLPRIGVYTVTTQRNANTGLLVTTRTPLYFSDRPQYIAPLCRTASFTGTGCVETVVIYSTTPTPGQTAPFGNAGTIRWENLTTQQSHFFFEQAQDASTASADTLEVERFGSGCTVQPDGSQKCVGSADSLLVPARQEFITAHVPAFPADTVRKSDTTVVAIVVRKSLLGFRDTTFVRSSGNFRRAILGEGGDVQGSRAIAYDITRGMDSTVTLPNGTKQPLNPAMVDRGVSPPLDINKDIANTNARVKGVGINFDGELSAIRADSIYLLDANLVLQGTLATATSGNPGLDFYPTNAGNGITVPRTDCFLFAASTQPQIEVYDNHYYQLRRTIPIKAPIIGPVKSAVRTASGLRQIVLTGATAAGVVIVKLPDDLAGACPP